MDRHWCHMTTKFCLFVDENYDKRPMLYRLPKLHKYHINQGQLRILVRVLLFAELSILLTSCYTATEKHDINILKTFQRNGNNLFGSIKTSV